MNWAAHPIRYRRPLRCRLLRQPFRGGQQLPGIGMLHMAGDQIVAAQAFDDGTLLHDGNAITQMRDHRQVMADENAETSTPTSTSAHR